MICEKCGVRPATFHSSVNINGVKQETHLCEECANKYCKNDISLQNFFNDFDCEIDKINNAICDNCGSSFDDFRSSGLLGCPDCYDTFRDNLMDIITDVQGSDTHSGKTIEFDYDDNKTSKNNLTADEKIEKLQEQINEAVKVEDYELASKLKKEIENIREKK